MICIKYSVMRYIKQFIITILLNSNLKNKLLIKKNLWTFSPTFMPLEQVPKATET